MSNDFKIKPVKVILDKPRNLLFDLNAFEVLEDLYENEKAIDKDGSEVVSALSKAFRLFESDKKKIKHIKNFLYAGLVYEDEDLTPAIVGTWIGYSNINEITDNIWNAISNSLPEPKEGSEDSSGE